MWLTCQRKDCDRQRWRAICLQPGTIGATIVALFGFDQALGILADIRPESVNMMEEDAYSLALTRATDRCTYLQFSITKHEYENGIKDWQRSLQVLRITIV